MGDRTLVLVVEDDEANRILLEQLLEDYDVVTAKNGAEAVIAAKEHVPDVILMDLGLPRKSGIEAAAEIRAVEECSHIPIIAVTAHVTRGFRDIIETTFEGFVSKPIDEKKLVEAIESGIQAAARARAEVT